MDVLCLFLNFTDYLDALMIFAIVALIVGAVILRGAQRYNCAGTALLVGMIFIFVRFVGEA